MDYSQLVTSIELIDKERFMMVLSGNFQGSTMAGGQIALKAHAEDCIFSAAIALCVYCVSLLEATALPGKVPR